LAKEKGIDLDQTNAHSTLSGLILPLADSVESIQHHEPLHAIILLLSWTRSAMRKKEQAPAIYLRKCLFLNMLVTVISPIPV
jgi:predicted amino acid racemase